MHEMTVAHGLLTILEERAKAHGIARITRIRLKIGRLRGLETRQLRAAFEVLAEGAIAEGAPLDIEEVAARARCNACGTEWGLPDYRFECPKCQSADAEILAGRELHIESFDGERDE
ncbi:hydrogenase maturation nickel metallochaperone HypA [Roseiarcus sp.]|uniref:hydrogenase maturation nickel metallochaperone HypA n=1 Tax=Roseiarcus sp. TaxID=1969460 RepID=UPI003F9D21EA